MTKDHELILLGVISSAYGIKGDIIVKSYTDPVDNIANLKLFDNKNIIFPIKKIRVTPKGSIICRHSNCHNRNQAESIIGVKLYCMREDLPKTDKEEFYFEDLKNLQVLNLKRKKVGIISGIFNFGAGDLIEIKFSNESVTEIYPFTKEFFLEVTKDYVVLAKSNLFIK